MVAVAGVVVVGRYVDARHWGVQLSCAHNLASLLFVPQLFLTFSSTCHFWVLILFRVLQGRSSLARAWVSQHKLMATEPVSSFTFIPYLSPKNMSETSCLWMLTIPHFYCYRFLFSLFCTIILAGFKEDGRVEINTCILSTIWNQKSHFHLCFNIIFTQNAIFLKSAPQLDETHESSSDL